MECKHDISLLLGNADGIVCRGCGKLFPDYDAALVDRGEAPAPAEEKTEKKPAAKKTASKKAKKED